MAWGYLVTARTRRNTLAALLKCEGWEWKMFDLKILILALNVFSPLEYR